MSTTEASGADPTLAPPTIHLSPTAMEKIREMLAEEELLPEGGLRISARPGGGCSAPLQYGLIMETEPEPDDLVLSGEGIRIFLDPRSAWSVDGLLVDYVDSPFMGSGFAFRRGRGAVGSSCSVEERSGD
jgi:iron-sulfur cluster insertion protein